MQRFAMPIIIWAAFTLVSGLPIHAKTTTAYPEKEMTEEPAGKTSTAARVLSELNSISLDRFSKATIAFTTGGRPIDVYYFPGRSDKRALVLAGVHGSELSGIQVAALLINRLQDSSAKPYYSTWVVPCLFPDNAFAATQQLKELNSCKNIGRYTSPLKADPNRQMPPAESSTGHGIIPFDPLVRSRS